ncbi:MAG: nucleotidyltransferase family protein [Chloroflexi bacterium]|nr:MAG: nucleotidyltransferase family protein [Chloroflexota bacterium]
MKAMILSAGEGTRLRPLTLTTPKPMLPVGGRPLLEHIILNLQRCGISDIGINLYHLPEKVIDYFGTGRQLGVNIRYSVETTLLGSAGGVKRLAGFFDQTFVVYYGDVFTFANLRPMIELHRQSGAPVTMGLYRVPDPWNRGIVELDSNKSIVRFVEKPPKDLAFSNLANAGIYVLEPEILNWIPANTHYDFGHDVFPNLLAQGVKVAGYVINEPIIDIGLPEKYAEANAFVSEVAV